MKKSLALIGICIFLISCGSEGEGDIATGDGRPPTGGQNDVCSRPSGVLTDAGFASSAELTTFMTNNNFTNVEGNTSEVDIVRVIQQYQKVPTGMQNSMRAAGDEFRLINGFGVANDPTFPTPTGATSDGRPFTTVRGAHVATTNTTYIVANRILEFSGNTSLTLHEIGHAISNGPMGQLSAEADWQQIFNNASANRLLDLITATCPGTYCTQNAEEAFAEAFAIYFNCSASRARFSTAPAVREYFENLEAAF